MVEPVLVLADEVGDSVLLLHLWNPVAIRKSSQGPNNQNNTQLTNV